MKRRIFPLLLTLLLLCTLVTPAMAQGSPVFSDIAPGAWYGDAANYVRDRGLMGGTTETTFSPNTTASRAMLVTILYRHAGSPAAQPANFTDVSTDTWYSNAAGWAATEGIISGYSDGRFGPNDPVTREQLATILWRTDGSPTASGAGQFADQSAIALFATRAVAWAWEQGIVSGKEGNRFAPQDSATRAELAVMLHRWLLASIPTPTPPSTGSKTLVAYFSCTGGTKALAEALAQHLGADLYAITPDQPYTAGDLDYRDSTSRSAREQNDPAARPALGGATLNLSSYDRVYLGYPLWFGQAPRILSTFLESHDFAGKTIIPFCTSGSSALGSSAQNLRPLAATATWLEGRRFDRGATPETLAAWADGLFAQAPAPDEEEGDSLPKLRIQVGGRSFAATLVDNAAARSFAESLPMTVEMGELNGNEKYYYLPKALPTSSQRPGTLRTGDLMLYGSDCLVLFYETFSSGYSYTPLGSVDDPAGLAAALGGGSVEVTFEAS